MVPMMATKVMGNIQEVILIMIQGLLQVLGVDRPHVLLMGFLHLNKVRSTRQRGDDRCGMLILDILPKVMIQSA